MEEMNEFETKPRGTFWRDWGVYGALALCLAVIGAAVALTSLPEKEEAREQPQEIIVSEAPRQDPLPVNKPQQQAEAAPARSAGGEKKAQAPVSGKVIWGYAADKLIYSKTLDQWTTHKAVDIACPQGTAVKCVLGGTVERVYTDDQLGVTVIVKHSSDRKTLYANLSETVPVKAGDKVNAGTVLGTVGKTAISECALESHLHFAFFVKGKAVDPTGKVKLG